MNVKIAAELLHPSDHPWDANPNAERRPAVMAGHLIAVAVISDYQTQSLAAHI